MNQATATAPMSGHRAPKAHRNTRLVRRFFIDVLAGGSERAANDLIAPDAIIDLPTGRFSGPDGVRRAAPSSVRSSPISGSKSAVSWPTEIG
jgi:hypothetical protein